MQSTEGSLPSLPQRPLLSTLRDDRTLLTAVLMLSSVFAFSMLAARMLKAGSWDYRFLAWNLFLAWMPFWFALAIEALDRRRASAATMLAFGAGWLVFFPNAPYILTDFVHLRQRMHVPLWYDISMLTAFAWNGLLLGFASLRMCHRVVERRIGVRAGWGLVVVTLYLAGFGVYLGRVVRWNSWDVLTSPLALVSDVASRLVNPAAHPRTWGMTIVLGGFLLLGYVTLVMLSRLSREEPSPSA